VAARFAFPAGLLISTPVMCPVSGEAGQGGADDAWDQASPGTTASEEVAAGPD
jgi:hypothetical protein